MQYINVANQGVKSLSPYQAGKPIEELERELGITNIVNLPQMKTLSVFLKVRKSHSSPT